VNDVLRYASNKTARLDIRLVVPPERSDCRLVPGRRAGATGERLLQVARVTACSAVLEPRAGALDVLPRR